MKTIQSPKSAAPGFGLLRRARARPLRLRLGAGLEEPGFRPDCAARTGLLVIPDKYCRAAPGDGGAAFSEPLLHVSDSGELLRERSLCGLFCSAGARFRATDSRVVARGRGLRLRGRSGERPDPDAAGRSCGKRSLRRLSEGGRPGGPRCKSILCFTKPTRTDRAASCWTRCARAKPRWPRPRPPPSPPRGTRTCAKSSPRSTPS